MTLTEFKALLLSVDSGAKPWKGPGTGNYTVFMPTRMLGLDADGKRVETGWRIYVERFTKNPDDPMVDQITAALDGHDDIAFDIEETQFEIDTGYFQFIWRCEVI